MVNSVVNYFMFEKDPDNRWYIILPEWEGDRAELEMVSGADTMLDIISQGENRVGVSLSLKPFDGSKYSLNFIKEQSGGGTYDLRSKYHNFEVWLCHVVIFVF